MIVQNFVLKDQDGNDFELYKNLDKKVLLVFYPGDNTYVCSRQLSDYSKNIKKFDGLGIRIAGINSAGIESHKDFCVKSGLNFPLLADPDKEISRRFDALNLFGINKRKLVMINRAKEIVYEKTLFSLSYYNTSQLLNALNRPDLQQ